MSAEDPSGTHTHCRPAVAADSSDLAILADAATRRVLSWLWEAAAEPGQSAFEIGRNTMYSNSESLSHFSRWRVAEQHGEVVGAVNSYLLVPPDMAASPPQSDVVVPLNELKAIAAGTWYVSVASVFPESRDRGIGSVMLADTAEIASAAGATQLTLLVGSFNPSAKRLYERIGFSEWARRAFTPFPGSDEAGDWILMVKNL